jgi:hypothetical protein
VHVSVRVCALGWRGQRQFLLARSLVYVKRVSACMFVFVCYDGEIGGMQPIMRVCACMFVVVVVGKGECK